MDKRDYTKPMIFNLIATFISIAIFYSLTKLQLYKDIESNVLFVVFLFFFLLAVSVGIFYFCVSRWYYE